MRLRARHPFLGRGIISPALSSHPRTTWHNIFYLVAEAARFRFLFVEQALLAARGFLGRAGSTTFRAAVQVAIPLAKESWPASSITRVSTRPSVSSRAQAQTVPAATSTSPRGQGLGEAVRLDASAKWGRLVRRFWPVFETLSSSESGHFQRPPTPSGPSLYSTTRSQHRVTYDRHDMDECFPGIQFPNVEFLADELTRVLRPRLAPSTRILFVGTGRDPVIERYWQWRRLHDAPKQLAELGIQAAVVPNYSLSLDDPRPQHLANRKRSLICAREMASAGLAVIPYLQALTPTDWGYWRRFLEQHNEVRFVAKEFQTGLARPERGRDAILELRKLASEIGRPLHIIAIGGAQYARDLAAGFQSWTIVDSIPFMKAIKRRAAHPGADRIQWRQALDDDPGLLLDHNVLAYEQWISKAVS